MRKTVPSSVEKRLFLTETHWGIETNAVKNAEYAINIFTSSVVLHQSRSVVVHCLILLQKKKEERAQIK